LILELLNQATTVARLAWVGAAVSIWIASKLGEKPARLVRWLFWELRPFFLPCVAGAVIIDPFVQDQGAIDVPDAVEITINAVLTVAQVGLWFWLKDVDKGDNRWKRRRKRAMDKVRQLGGRPVVAAND